MLFLPFIIYTQYWIERSFRKQVYKSEVQGFVEQQPQQQKPSSFTQWYYYYYYY